MFIIQMFGHISYAIINPSVAIAAIVHKLISVKVSGLIGDKGYDKKLIS